MIFEVFGLKFSAKKSIYQICPIKRGAGGEPKKAILKNLFFGANFDKTFFERTLRC